MAAAAQADRTERNACGSSSRSLLRGRGRTIRCDPIGGAIHWNGSERDQLGRSRRDRKGDREIAGSPNGGLIVTTSALSFLNRDLIIALAARHKLPAIYYRRYFATLGGLISYGVDVLQQFRGAADYVDRILRGRKPAKLRVQAPTKYELVINLKAAKLLGLTVADSLLAIADEVIE